MRRYILVLSLLAAACRPTPSSQPVPLPACAVNPLPDENPDPSIVEITLHAGASDWDPGNGVPIHGNVYGGGGPAPLIVVNAGDTLRVHFTNDLTVPTTIHWHGVRAPWLMDGVPGETQSAIAPGETFLYQFVVPDPGLYWFHPHMDTAMLIDSGLYGLLLVKDPAEPAVGCDMPIALDDIDLGPDGQMRMPTPATRSSGHLGNMLLANGRNDFSVPIVPGGHDLLRFANAANARTFDLELEGHTMTVVGFDGGFLTQPYEVNHLEIAPGERYEVLVKGTGLPGHAYALLDRRDLTDPNESDPLGKGPTKVLTLVYATESVSEAEPSFPAAPLPAWTPALTPLHTWVLGDTMSGGTMIGTVDGQLWPNVPLQTVVVDGNPITVAIESNAMGAHPMHFHGERLLVVARNGVPLEHVGWKDTVQVWPGDRLTLVSDFSNLGRWMFHCHILEHAEDGMMSEFNAVQGP